MDAKASVARVFHFHALSKPAKPNQRLVHHPSVRETAADHSPPDGCVSQSAVSDSVKALVQRICGGRPISPGEHRCRQGCGALTQALKTGSTP